MDGDATRAYAGFEGRVGRTFAGSEPDWPTRPKAPRGAPNVVVVLADDLGFSDLGCYGSEIATPNLDRIATGGLRYTNFHVTPLCSPTRAALLTGRNSHAVGVGMVSNIDPGFPGYTSELADNQPTMAEVLRANGYATLMVGKWHLCKDSDLNEAGNRSSWPLQRGFDQYYGFLEALTNFHQPHRLVEGNSVVHVDDYPDDYYLTDDLTDRAERMIREVKGADPDKPFFLYFAHGAVHAPLHAKARDIARQRGRYAGGWDAVRERRLDRQLRLGIMPEGTRLPPRNHEDGLDVAAWDSLTSDEQALFARYMEVYAAMVESIDESVGRVRQVLEELGEWDNTIFLFTSDNGASREGFDKGSTSYFRKTSPTATTSDIEPEDQQAYDEDRIGGPTTWPHYPRGWAMACNTPFRLYKITTYRGGHQVPLIVSWPSRVSRPGQILSKQHLHVTDLLPTLVDVGGLAMPQERHGQPAGEPAGVSFGATLADPEAETAHNEQYYECNGNRGIHRDGWEAVTCREVRAPSQSLPDRDDLVPLSQDRWELFNVREDPTQCVDLAASQPKLLAELKKAWEAAAWANQVFPINEGAGLNHLRRPPEDTSYGRRTDIGRGTPTLERYRSSRLIGGRSFAVAVNGVIRPGDEGVLVAHGGQESGYVLYVEDGRVHLEQNACGSMRDLRAALPSGEVWSVRLEVHAPGDRTWNVAIDVDGKRLVEDVGWPQLGDWLPFEGIDVGIDRRSPVSWAVYERRGPFPFTGRLDGVSYEPGELTATANEALLEEAKAVGLLLE